MRFRKNIVPLFLTAFILAAGLLMPDIIGNYQLKAFTGTEEFVSVKTTELTLAESRSIGEKLRLVAANSGVRIDVSDPDRVNEISRKLPTIMKDIFFVDLEERNWSYTLNSVMYYTEDMIPVLTWECSIYLNDENGIVLEAFLITLDDETENILKIYFLSKSNYFNTLGDGSTESTSDYSYAISKNDLFTQWAEKVSTGCVTSMKVDEVSFDGLQESFDGAGSSGVLAIINNNLHYKIPVAVYDFAELDQDRALFQKVNLEMVSRFDDVFWDSPSGSQAELLFTFNVEIN